MNLAGVIDLEPGEEVLLSAIHADPDLPPKERSLAGSALITGRWATLSGWLCLTDRRLIFIPQALTKQPGLDLAVAVGLRKKDMADSNLHVIDLRSLNQVAKTKRYPLLWLIIPPVIGRDGGIAWFLRGVFWPFYPFVTNRLLVATAEREYVLDVPNVNRWVRSIDEARGRLL